MREAFRLTRRTTALVIIVVAVTAYLGAYVYYNPSGITPIADINAGRVAVGENVTIRGTIVSIMLLFMGPNDQIVTVSEGQANITFGWYDFRLMVGWVIIARGVVHSSHELGSIVWLDRVWLFV